MAQLVQRDEVLVMYVVAKGGVSGSNAAFEQLESRFPTLRGRKFFATVHRGEYRPCVAIRDDDDPEALGLPTEVIPGGTYVKQRLEGGFENIGPTFDAMAAEHRHDRSRPVIEFYRRHNDVRTGPDAREQSP